MTEVAAGLPVASPPPRASGASSGARGEGFTGILDRGARTAERPLHGASGDDEAVAEDGEIAVSADERGADAELQAPGETDADTAPLTRRLGGFAALRLAFDALERRLGPSPAGEAGEEQIETAPVEDGEGGGETEETPLAGLALAVPQPLQAAPAPRGTRGDKAEPRQTPAPILAEAAADADAGAEETVETRKETLRPVEMPRSGARAGQDQAGENGGNGRSAMPDALPMRVNVVGETNNIATAGPQNAQTVASLASAIATDADWSTVARELRAANPAPETPAPGPVRDLRIQLNPASLGEVNARLRIAGDQLTVEIRVDNSEAMQRLSVDREAIATALRGLGFKVDDVTIVQQQSAAASGQNPSGGREGGSAAGLSQGSEREQGGQSGTGRDGRNADQGRQNADAQAHRAGTDAGGVYI